jgi:hypothetical protein
MRAHRHHFPCARPPGAHRRAPARELFSDPRRASLGLDGGSLDLTTEDTENATEREVEQPKVGPKGEPSWSERVKGGE